MPTDTESDLHLEIGYVLFIDIVGYSKLLIDEQREQIQELREIVRGTEQFRLAEAEGKLMRLPRAMAVRWFFALVRRHLFCALWKLARH